MAAPLLLTCALLAVALGAGAAPPQLKFSEEGEFKMIQLTDLHLGSTGLRDRRTARVRAPGLGMEDGWA